MDAYSELLLWASTKGIKLDGIEPRQIPGRGVGIVAARAIKTEEKILQVPTSTLRTLETVPSRITKRLPKNLTVHGILAADLALDPSPSKLYARWNAVIPTREDVWDSMPLTWDAQLQEFLPRTARNLLRKQLAKFERDWAAVKTAFSHDDSSTVSRDDYLYAWLLVNTRTFYHETERTKKLSRDDRMIMQPVADLFNHADQGCNVSFDPSAFTIAADREYAEGEEVYISYGNHSNDFLLTEYGFVLSENRWDEVCLDDALLPELSTRQKGYLEESGFLGNYMLDDKTVCYRTQVALRLMCTPLAEWRRFVDFGDDDDGCGGRSSRHQDKADRLLVSILREYEMKAMKTIRDLGELEGVGRASQRAMLSQRWRQIRGLIDRTITRLES
ncbi:hypothetical protein B0H63DRAFT_555359 [Podospora didyma]|uniref:SET domain-containing protein n=1 Tax=Podospora didyma TaxID=330526 RepID=A0AAE0P690_9PEZI|nr:hypothetical protein B0H63DRAFT_555359 [Podospora didyma]